jgi:hypothetical protein
MRRLAAPVLALVVLAGCSGEQGERAQQLLDRAQAAQARLTSMSYEMRMNVAFEGQRMTLVLDGGGYLKGRRAGDQVMTMRMEGLQGVAGMNAQMLLRGQRMTMTMNGRQFLTSVPASAKTRYDMSGSMAELARYVKDVRVREPRIVNGEPGATVSGVIDTAGLLKAVTKLQAFSQVSGTSAPDLSDVADHLTDTRAALFISRRTGLIRSAVVSLGFKAKGKRIDFDLTYRLTSVNRAIAGL